ncbi:unnamed protein product [Closterium sp. NIES-53]
MSSQLCVLYCRAVFVKSKGPPNSSLSVARYPARSTLPCPSRCPTVALPHRRTAAPPCPACRAALLAAHCPSLPARRSAGHRATLCSPHAALCSPAGRAPPSPACRVALLAAASPCPARAPPCWPPRRPALPARRPALPAHHTAGSRAALPSLRAALMAAAQLPAPPCYALPCCPCRPAAARPLACSPAGRRTALQAAALLCHLRCPALAAVLTFDHEGRPIQFDTWLNDLQLYLLSDSRDSVLLFDHTSGASLAPPATADTATRSQWLTRDAAARLAVRNHLPLAERAHFGQHKIAKALYDVVVTRYSSPVTAALGRLILPNLFPKLSAFATVEDLINYLRTSDTRYRAALPAEFLDKNPPPMYITLYFIVTRLPDSLRAVGDHFLALDPTYLIVDLLEKHLLAAETSVVAVGAARGTPRTPFFEGGKRRSGKGKRGKSGGGGSRGGGGRGDGGGGGGGGGGGSGGGSGAFGGGSGGSGGSGGGGGGGSGSGGGRGGALQRGGSGGGQRQIQQRLRKTPTPQQLRIEAAVLGASESCLPGTARAEAMHTFTLDSGAPRCFFRDSTTLTPLPAPVPVRLTDHSGGPVLARSSTVLPCTAVPSGSISSLHLPSFSTNLVSTGALQDAMVTTTTPGGQRESICTCTRTGRHLATFTRQPGSSLYTLSTEPPQVAAYGEEQTLHMDLWGPARVSGQDRERYSRLVVDDYTRYTTIFPLRSKGEVPDVLIHWIRTVRLQLRERFREDLLVLCLSMTAVSHLVAMLLAPEGYPDALDIPTPRSYAESITGPYSSQWQTAMDVEMASWKSRGTYVDTIAPPGANIVDGMWIFRGVDFFQTFFPTPKMTTLQVLLHVAAHLRRPVYGLRQVPCEWHDTLRTTLVALGFAPSIVDPSLFLHTDTSMPPFYILVYVDDFIFATADAEAVTLVKSELQKRNTCTNLGELRSYLGLQITRDSARRTITLTYSHMAHQVLQRFGFRYSSSQSTPLPTGYSLSAPPSYESVEPSGPYPELVGCLITSGMGLVLGGWGPVVPTGHADASWVDDLATQRSSQGYNFSLGSGWFSWRSTRSSSVLSSCCEAEIYAGAIAMKPQADGRKAWSTMGWEPGWQVARLGGVDASVLASTT